MNTYYAWLIVISMLIVGLIFEDSFTITEVIIIYLLSYLALEKGLFIK